MAHSSPLTEAEKTLIALGYHEYELEGGDIVVFQGIAPVLVASTRREVNAFYSDILADLPMQNNLAYPAYVC